MTNARALQLQQPWIDAFTDSKAEIQTFSSCLTLADLNADGEYKFVAADFGIGTTTKLKVYKGTVLTTEIQLLSPPCAVATIYTDTNRPRIPGIAVVTGGSVLVYRNCRPYYKFTLPPRECQSLEADAWQRSDSSEPLVHLLRSMASEVGLANLSLPSRMLLSADPPSREDFFRRNCNSSLTSQESITCIATINKNNSDEKDVTCLLLATESSMLFVMDPETFTVAENFNLRKAPYLMAAAGIFVVEYYVAMACLDGSIQFIRNGKQGVLTHTTTPPVSLFLTGQGVVTVHMDGTLQSHSFKGGKQWEVNLGCRPLCACILPVDRLAVNLIAVSLDSCVVQLYQGPSLVYTFSSPDPVSSMIFGKYGREEHALVTVLSGGTLAVKLLKRTAQFSDEKKRTTESANPQDIKLLIPKKSKLIIEQTLRERQYCKEMHAWFQMTKLGLNLTSGRAYLAALKTATVSQKENVKMALQVVGLGPSMKIQISIENVSGSPPGDLAVTFIYDPQIYKIETPYIPVPTLVPGLTVHLDAPVVSKLPISGQIQVLLVAEVILLTATITMPVSAIL